MRCSLVASTFPALDGASNDPASSAACAFAWIRLPCPKTCCGPCCQLVAFLCIQICLQSSSIRSSASYMGCHKSCPSSIKVTLLQIWTYHGAINIGNSNIWQYYFPLKGSLFQLICRGVDLIRQPVRTSLVSSLQVILPSGRVQRQASPQQTCDTPRSSTELKQDILDNTYTSPTNCVPPS